MMRITNVILAAIVMSVFAMPGWARLPAPLPSTSPRATEVKNPHPAGCVAGINRVYTFEGHIEGDISPAGIQQLFGVHSKTVVHVWLRLLHPISVCSFHLAGTFQPAYTNVTGIGFGIYSVKDYRFMMGWWGNDRVLITGSLGNVEFTGHSGGPVIFDKNKQFCYSRKSQPAVFLCMPWQDFENFF